MAIASGVRDDEVIRAGIERWLRAHDPDLVDGTVAPISRPAAGLSSDTAFVQAVTPSGAVTHFVVRLAPAGEGLFPEYDLRGQADVQNRLGELGIPVAHPVRYEEDCSWLGDPFMVMPRVAGRVLARTYLAKGWVADATPNFRRDLVLGFVHGLASVHRLAPAVDSGGDPVGRAFQQWSGYLDWATGGGAPLEFMHDARDWCADHAPRLDVPPSMLWGDVQLTNAVFATDGSVAALLDWEMTGTGPPEMDLGWFLALHEMTIEQHGSTLPGIPTRAEIIAVYEADLGRAVQDVRWFEAFALIRSGSIMIRMARILSAQGIDDGWLSTRNPTETALARVLTSEE